MLTYFFSGFITLLSSTNPRCYDNRWYFLFAITDLLKQQMYKASGLSLKLKENNYVDIIQLLFLRYNETLICKVAP